MWLSVCFVHSGFQLQALCSRGAGGNLVTLACMQKKEKSLLCFDVRFHVAKHKSTPLQSVHKTLFRHTKIPTRWKTHFWLICEAGTCLTANIKHEGGILSLNISFLPRHQKPGTQLPTSPRLRLLGTKPLLLWTVSSS